MLIDLDYQLVTIENEPLKDEKDDYVFLRTILKQALLGGDQSKLSGEDKATRYELALRMQAYNGDGNFSVSVDEAKLLKDEIGKNYGALIVGQVWQLIDPKDPNTSVN